MKIALTDCGSGPKKQGYYVNWLQSVNGVEVVELSATKNNASELEGCAGLVFSGGNDVHPSYYNNSKLDYPGAEEFDEARDQFEKNIFLLAQKKQMPVLGICRGMQFINCMLGGSLKQDLSELNGTHRGSPDKRHFVDLVPGTMLHQIANANEAEVNSSHHQAIDKLGNGLKINCLAADKTIEGVESIGGEPFILAVQWHPERMFSFQLEKTSMSKGIRDYFFERIQNS